MKRQRRLKCGLCIFLCALQVLTTLDMPVSTVHAANGQEARVLSELFDTDNTYDNSDTSDVHDTYDSNDTSDVHGTYNGSDTSGGHDTYDGSDTSGGHDIYGSGDTSDGSDTYDGEDTVASGCWHGMDWRIVQSGYYNILTISGEYRPEAPEGTSWKEYSGTFTQAKVTARNVTSTAEWFSDCRILQSIDLSEFDSSQVTDMHNMFYNCNWLEEVNFDNLDTSHVTNMSGLFYCCYNLHDFKLNSLDTSQVTDMSHMFYYCHKLTHLDLSGLDTSHVTNMRGMFHYCPLLREADLSGLDLGHVKDMSYLFYNCHNMVSLDLSGIRADQVEDMSYMLFQCSSLTSVNLEDFHADSLKNMRFMFTYCSRLTDLNLKGFWAGQITDLESVFTSCSKLTSLDLSGFHTSHTTNMHYMFHYCRGLTALDLSGFDTSQVTDLSGIFSDCDNLSYVNLSGWDTGKVQDISKMFYDCRLLTGLDLSSFDFTNVTKAEDCFYNCFSLVQVFAPTHLNLLISLPYPMGDEEGSYYDTLPLNLEEPVALLYLTHWIMPIPDQTFTGKTLTPEFVVRYGMHILTPGVDYTYTYKNNKVAASADAAKAPTVIVRGKGNYSGVLKRTFTILAMPLTEENTELSPMVYNADGRVKKASPTVKAGGKRLVPNKDYTLEYPDTSAGAYQNPGTYPVILHGQGNYGGDITAEMVILSQNQIPVTHLKVASIPACVYEDGRPATPSPRITYHGQVLQEGVDYSLSYQDNDRPGKAVLTITGLENSAGNPVFGTLSKSFVIKGISLKKAKITFHEESNKKSNQKNNQKMTYTGSALCPNITLSIGDTTLRQGIDYDLSYENNMEAGKAAIRIIGCGGYTDTIIKTFSILPAALSPKQLTVTFTDTLPDGTGVTSFDQSGAKPEITVKNGESTLAEGKDYILTYKNNKKPCSADAAKAPTIIIKGIGNYTFQKEVRFTITAKSLTDKDISIYAPDRSRHTDKNACTIPVVKDANGKKLLQNRDYTILGWYADGKAIDKDTDISFLSDSALTVKIQGKGNYTGEVEAPYHVIWLDIAKTRVKIAKIEYTGGKTILTRKMAWDGLLQIYDPVERDTLDYGYDYTIVGYTNNQKVGTATVTIEGKGIYGGRKTVTFQIIQSKMSR